MPLIRRIYRIAALAAWFIIPPLLAVPWQIRGDRRSIEKINRFTRLWSRGIARLVNLRVTVTGAQPDLAGALIVSNHTSYLDIITHGSLFPVRYAAKADIAAWPFLGWYLGQSRPIWTDRSSRQASEKALRAFTKTMKRGIPLIVYPEGTTTDGAHGILPFKSTAFEAAITGNVPVIPILTRYRDVPGRPTVCWYGDMTLMPHVWQVLGYPSIEAEVRFLAPVYPEGRSRKELAAYVQGIMAREYRALCGEKEVAS